MKTILLYLSIVFLWIEIGQAQNKKALDSLMRVYPTLKIDTVKVLWLIEMAYQYRFSHSDSTIIYAQRAITESKNKRFLNGEGQSWNILGIGYERKASYALALDCYEKAYNVFQKTNYAKGFAITYKNMAVVYEHQANYIKALAYNQKALDIEEKQGNLRSVAQSLGNIGILYEKQGDFLKSLAHHQKSLDVFTKLGIEEDIGTALGNVGVVYYYLNDLNKALEYYKKGLVIQEKTGNKLGIATSLNNIGEVYYNQTDFPKAIEYLERSLIIHQQIGDKQGAIYPLNCMAISYQKQKNYDKSIQYAQNAYEIAKQINELLLVKESSNILYESYKLKGDYDKALQYHEAYKQVNDTIYNKEKTRAFAKLESKAEIAQKEKEIIILSKDRALQRIEVEREKITRLAEKKEAEANHFRSLAKEEKNKYKQDSLFALATQSQLESNVLKAQERTLRIEAQARTNIMYFMIAGLVGVILLAYFIFRSQQKEKKAKEESHLQKEEIQTQAEHLDASNKTKDRLFAIIAHDLRNPIMSFQGVAKQISVFLKKNKPERVIDLVETIDEYSHNLNNLLDNLLNWALVQRQDIQLNPQPLKLKQEIDICLQGFGAFATAYQLTLENKIKEEEYVTIDKNILHTIIRNLVGNAIKFTPKGGIIQIASTKEGNLPTKISIKDSGVGISPEKAAIIFQLQQDKSAQGLHGEKGIGIGLNLCYELAKISNCKLDVESKLNEGTTFYIIIP